MASKAAAARNNADMESGRITTGIDSRGRHGRAFLHVLIGIASWLAFVYLWIWKIQYEPWLNTDLVWSMIALAFLIFLIGGIIWVRWNRFLYWHNDRKKKEIPPVIDTDFEHDTLGRQIDAAPISDLRREPVVVVDIDQKGGIKRFSGASASEAERQPSPPADPAPKSRPGLVHIGLGPEVAPTEPMPVAALAHDPSPVESPAAIPVAPVSAPPRPGLTPEELAALGLTTASVAPASQGPASEAPPAAAPSPTPIPVTAPPAAQAPSAPTAAPPAPVSGLPASAAPVTPPAAVPAPVRVPTVATAPAIGDTLAPAPAQAHQTRSEQVLRHFMAATSIFLDDPDRSARASVPAPTNPVVAPATPPVVRGGMEAWGSVTTCVIVTEPVPGRRIEHVTSMDQGLSWSEPRDGGGLRISDEGLQMVSFRSVNDGTGEASEWSTPAVSMIDRSAPSAPRVIQDDTPGRQRLRVVDAIDLHSGVAALEFRLSADYGQTWSEPQAGDTIDLPADRDRIIQFRAIDGAGNIGEWASALAPAGAH